MATPLSQLRYMLENFGAEVPERSDLIAQALQFLDAHPYSLRPFYRDCFDDGHFTSGVLVSNYSRDRVLLMHHKKFDRWVQFGGHLDGEVDVFTSALRELEEESGISRDQIQISRTPLSFDIHEVLPYDHEPQHQHYDINFLAFAPEHLSYRTLDGEGYDISWFDVAEIVESTDDDRFTSGLRSILSMLMR